jgi:hypothetical protein
MARWNRAIRPYLLVTMVASAAMATAVGCVGITSGPDLGFVGVPIPVSPYFQKFEEDRAWHHERYARVPVLPPLAPGGPEVGLDEPSDDEVIRALERAKPVQGGLPMLYEVQRNNVRIVKEKIADYIDPPRFVPLIGPAQLHHVHWKCTIYYTETIRVGWPVPHTIRDEDAVEVIYIDHNHFHMVGNVQPPDPH